MPRAQAAFTMAGGPLGRAGEGLAHAPITYGQQLAFEIEPSGWNECEDCR